MSVTWSYGLNKPFLTMLPLVKDFHYSSWNETRTITILFLSIIFSRHKDILWSYSHSNYNFSKFNIDSIFIKRAIYIWTIWLAYGSFSGWVSFSPLSFPDYRGFLPCISQFDEFTLLPNSLTQPNYFRIASTSILLYQNKTMVPELVQKLYSVLQKSTS